MQIPCSLFRFVVRLLQILCSVAPHSVVFCRRMYLVFGELKEISFVGRIININFCFRLEKRATETLETLKQVQGCDTLSGTQAFEWLRRFREGRESDEDDKRYGRPRTSRMLYEDQSSDKVKSASQAN
ncbi:hypothetical protein TNCV_1703761 [Trichonephila clavipes]|nr:hypothetical protein TNCV_1703761 [Trichonephila clavipes]